MQKLGLARATTDREVTPQAQKTGNSPVRIEVASYNSVSIGRANVQHGHGVA
jgi:hypothetical protein